MNSDMDLVPIWDSQYRYRSFRVEGGVVKSLQTPDGKHTGESYIPQRIRLTYRNVGDPDSNGGWVTTTVDVEGYHSRTTAPVFLSYKEPGLGSAPADGDWLPDWLRKVAADNLPGVDREREENPPATALVSPPGPMPPAEVGLYQRLEQRANQPHTPPVAWTAPQPVQVTTLAEAATQVLPQAETS